MGAALKIDRTNVFDGGGRLCHYREVEVRSSEPYARHADIACMGCAEPFQIEDGVLIELMTRQLLGIKCPKCGKNQAVGPVSRLCMVDLGPSDAGTPLLCSRVGTDADDYWKTPFEYRLWKYRWIDAHALLCEPCEKLLNARKEILDRKKIYVDQRGPRDWSPRGEMP